MSQAIWGEKLVGNFGVLSTQRGANNEMKERQGAF
jgi:hypothetical protein